MKLIDNKQRRMSKRVKVTLTRLTAWQRAASFTSGQQTPKKESNYNIKVFSFFYIRVVVFAVCEHTVKVVIKTNKKDEKSFLGCFFSIKTSSVKFSFLNWFFTFFFKYCHQIYVERRSSQCLFRGVVCV